MNVIKKLRQINGLHRKKDFLFYRHEHIAKALYITTLIGVLVTLGFHTIDRVLPNQQVGTLLFIRICISILFVVNAIIAYKTHKRFATHIFILFYIASVSCSLLSAYSGGFYSSYWFGLTMVLLVWLIAAPFSYKSKIINGFLMLIQYYLVLLVTGHINTDLAKITEVSIYLGSIYVLGVVGALLDNFSAYGIYVREIKLVESEKKYRSLINNAMDGIIITQDGKFVFVNPAFCNMTEYSEAELIGKPFADLIIEYDRERLLEIHRKRMQGEHSQFIYTSVGISKNGKRINLELNSSTIEYNNNPAGFIIIRDYTDRKIAEDLLIESEEKYKALVERANDGIVIIQDGYVRFINPMMAKILGYSVDNMIDTPFNEYLAYEERNRVGDIYRRRMAGENMPTIYESVLIGSDGHKRYVEFNNGLVNYKGKPATMVFIRDLTERKKSERALKESEQRYSLVVEGINDGTFDWDINTNSVFFSKRYKEILGFGENELNNDLSEWQNRIHPLDKEKVLLQNWDYIYGKIDKYELEYRLQHKDNSYRWILARGFCLRDKDGIAYRMVGTHSDITEKKHIEQLIRESEQKYRSIFDLAGDAIFLTEMNNGRIIEVNDSASIIYGYTREELLQMPYSALFAHDEIIDASYHDNPNVIEIPEQLHKKKDNSIITMEVTKSIYNQNNSDYQLVIAHDFTRRKQAEEELKQSEEHFRTLTATALDSIIMINGEGKITYWNHASETIFGHTASEAIGKNLHELITPERYREEYSSSLFKLIHGEIGLPSDKILELVACRRDGSEFPYEMSLSYFHSHGNWHGVGFLRDVSERKKAEEALRKSNERFTFHIQQTPMAYIEWNENLEVVNWNPAAEHIFGYSKKEAIHNHAYKLIVSDTEKPLIEKTWQNIMNEKGGNHLINENITKEGKTITCEWFNTPLKDKNGNITGLASLVQDISERKKLEKELAKTIAILEKDYSSAFEQMQGYFSELQIKKNELLQLQKENLQSQFAMLKNQVNPHFLFNSLNVLVSLISVDPELAEKFTGQLAKIYRYVLEHKSEDLVTIKNELDFLNSYRFLLDIRFSGKLKINVNIADDMMNYKLPPLAMQLLIENAIKHNTFSAKSPLVINIYIDNEGYLIIENNFQKRERVIESTGVGLENIANRYAYFTEKETFFGIIGQQFVAKVPLL